MPEVEHGSHLIEWLFQVGPVEQGANGPQVISWQELAAWKEATGTQATTEELSLLRRLSREYIEQHRKSLDPHQPAPYVVVVEDKVKLSDQIGSAFRRAAPKKK